MTKKPSLTVFEKHQLAIAKRTLKMPDPILAVMGGMTKEEAQEIVNRLQPKTKASQRTDTP